jgi:hypothetical protein
MLSALANLTHAVAEVEAVSMALARQLDAAPLCMCCHTLEERRAAEGKRRTLSGELAAVRANVDAILTGRRS